MSTLRFLEAGLSRRCCSSSEVPLLVGGSFDLGDAAVRSITVGWLEVSGCFFDLMGGADTAALLEGGCFLELAAAAPALLEGGCFFESAAAAPLAVGEKPKQTRTPRGMVAITAA